MIGDHWFDALNKTLVRSASRRDALRAAVLTTGVILTGVPDAGAAKKKRCSRQACRHEFSTKKDRDHCQTKCGRCRKRGKFCIVSVPEPKRATCCHADQECCHSALLNASGCLPPDRTCCADATFGICFKPDKCCPGVGCVDTTTNHDHCRVCNHVCAVDEECIDSACVSAACPDGSERCDGRCVDTTADRDHCGRCDVPCGIDQRCVNSGCEGLRCEPGLVPPVCPEHPQGFCVADETYVCCDGDYCVFSDGQDPDDYFCCGRGFEAPLVGCPRFDEPCASPNQYPPIATHQQGE